MTTLPHGASRRRSRDGFSFVEIMVALTILATVLGGLAVLSARITQRATTAQVLAQRNFILVQQLNRFNALPYDSLVKYSAVTKLDTIPSAVPTLRFVRRSSVYRVSTAPSDTNRYEFKVVIVPISAVKRDTQYKDSVILRRRNPRLTSPLNY